MYAGAEVMEHEAEVAVAIAYFFDDNSYDGL